MARALVPLALAWPPIATASCAVALAPVPKASESPLVVLDEATELAPIAMAVPALTAAAFAPAPIAMLLLLAARAFWPIAMLAMPKALAWRPKAEAYCPAVDPMPNMLEPLPRAVVNDPNIVTPRKPPPLAEHPPTTVEYTPEPSTGSTVAG